MAERSMELFNRELSWLEFNHRVLAEAQDRRADAEQQLKAIRSRVRALLREMYATFEQLTEPLTRGIQTALPYIDDFLPVHNLASLEQLAKHLGGLSERRPQRRQQGGGGQTARRG